MTAGIATLDVLIQPGVFGALVAATSRLGEGMAGAAQEAGVRTQHTRAGTMFCTFFTDGPVRDWATVKRADTALRPLFRDAGRGCTWRRRNLRPASCRRRTTPP